jgi:hypothetical protein
MSAKTDFSVVFASIGRGILYVGKGIKCKSKEHKNNNSFYDHQFVIPHQGDVRQICPEATL